MKNFTKLNYAVVGEMTIYTVENEKQYKCIVEKLNKQMGKEVFKLRKKEFPFTLTIDANEMASRLDMKNPFLAISQEEYDMCFLENAKEHIDKLLEWVNKHPHAAMKTCENFFSCSEMFNIETLNGGDFMFDAYFGPFTVTIIKENKKISVADDFEVYDDDYVAGSGEFEASDSVYEKIEEYWKEAGFNGEVIHVA